MKKLHETKRVGMVLLTMCLLWLVACKRDQLQPPTPSILNTYRGTDKMVLQVIETLKEPVNKALLAELEKQGSINWEYKALITSRFLEGITLRFVTGGNSNYLDAEVNAETKAIKLYSNQMQQQRDAMAEQAFGKRLGGNSTQAGVCTYQVSFEVDLFGLLIFEVVHYLQFRALLEGLLLEKGFNVVSVIGLDIRAPKYEVTFEPKNNETEADIRSLLVNSIEEYCRPQENPEGTKYCSWMIDKIRITNSCWDGSPLIQAIPPIIWRSASPVISYLVGDSYVDPLPFGLFVTPFKENGFWKVKIQSLTGGVSMIIRTGGYRDPDLDPPITAGQANDAINYMSAYFSRGSAQGWHTTAATLAHENYHYTEWKAIGNHYWQQVATCINNIKVPASGNDAADKALAENKANQVVDVDLWNACNTYLKTLGDGAGDRPYAAGQLELNKTITWIKQRANASGWWTTGNITVPNVDINNPTYQSFIPFIVHFKT